MESPRFSGPQSTASHLFAQTSSFHRPTDSKDSARCGGPDEKLPPTLGTNEIAGFVEFHPLTSGVLRSRFWDVTQRERCLKVHSSVLRSRFAAHFLPVNPAMAPFFACKSPCRALLKDVSRLIISLLV